MWLAVVLSLLSIADLCVRWIGKWTRSDDVELRHATVQRAGAETTASVLVRNNTDHAIGIEMATITGAADTWSNAQWLRPALLRGKRGASTYVIADHQGRTFATSWKTSQRWLCPEGGSSCPPTLAFYTDPPPGVRVFVLVKTDDGKTWTSSVTILPQDP